MTTFSQIVTLLGAVGGVGVLATMAFAPLLLDLPEPRPSAAARPGVTAAAAPVIPAQRVPAEPATTRAPRAAVTVGARA